MKIDDELNMRECLSCGKQYEHYNFNRGFIGFCKRIWFGNDDVLNLCDDCREELAEIIREKA